MWLSLSEQTAYFLWSIALGAAAAALYDPLRAVRILFKTGRAWVMVSDVVFFVVCGVMTSLFALPFNKGSVRAFIVFGEAVGFLCWRFSVGRVSGRFYSILSKGIKLILSKICELLKNFFDLLLKIASCVVYNVTVLIDKLKKKTSAHQKKAKSRTVRKSRTGGTRRSGREQKQRNGYERRYKKKENPHQGEESRRAG